jgi:hypothetical protein
MIGEQAPASLYTQASHGCGGHGRRTAPDQVCDDVVGCFVLEAQGGVLNSLELVELLNALARPLHPVNNIMQLAYGAL